MAGDRYDYYSRNQPPQPQIAPRFLKQKQQQASNASIASGNRLDQDQDQRPAVPKEIRLRDRDDRPSDRNSNYDSSRNAGSGNRDSWQSNSRDHERDLRDREIQFKRNYDKTERSSYSMGRDRATDKDNLNIKRKNNKLDSEPDLSKEDRPNSRNSNSRPALKDDNEKGGFLPLPLQSLTPEIVSWADEPAESYDDCSPLSILTAAGGERGSSDDRHGKSGGHAPLPMSRDKLEADARTETKSNFVSLRRQQGQTITAHGSTAPQSGSSVTTEDHQEKKRSTEVVQNVWTSRSKTREQQHQANEASKSGEEKSPPIPPEKEPIVDASNDKNDDADAANRKTLSSKDGRARAAPPPNKASNPNAAPMRRTTRRRGSNPRYSDSYDEYYGEEDNGVHYKPSEQQQQNPTAEPRKSKSPDEEDPLRKDSRRAPLTAASGSSSFRNRDNNRRGGTSRSYEDEDVRATKDNSSQRPPRFQQPQQQQSQQQPQQQPLQQQQEDVPGKSKTLAHQTSQDGVAETGDNPSEHNLSDSGNSSGRSNRRARGGNSNNDRRVRGPNDRSGKLEHEGLTDYYKESDASGPCQPTAVAEVVKESGNQDDGSKDHDKKSAAKEQHNDKVRSDARRNDRDRKDSRGDRSVRDERFRTNKTNERYDSRPKSNLPPRLAKQMETNRYKMHKTESEGQAVALAKESALTSSQQQQSQTSTAWEKSTPSGAPSPSLSSGMASLVLTSNESSVSEVTDDKPILDGTTPPVQTIIFENTNFKSSSVTALSGGDNKGRGTPPGQAQKCGVKTNQDSSSKSTKGGDILQMNVGKEEMQLDFIFGSGLNSADSSKTSGIGYSQAHALQLPVGSKMSGVPRIHHISPGVQSPISPSTAELNMKIASVKKVSYSRYCSILTSSLRFNECWRTLVICISKILSATHAL